ncbi:MAG: hypothetical protein OXU86_06290 [Thaumarchaeota archaeon]|nr:hypothetical protein [Nitrososphaerota archaeon]RNJ71354.1 MAG: hypothetical protein EB832_06165 [Thaumarchaeota archaeon S14]RNJ72416.1 MAG: hypothetical protein EB833_04900 [Thaumarchaeota archaeon S13]RNJ74089.1 MAG: hypothetical protein EB824_04015 [Thaumarchaeota archaeon S15]MDD9808389.1 hypothetical protein [Nitrososphaerota archaeon]
MVRQISLDSYQVRQMRELLERGSRAVEKTGTPITLYRLVLEEEDSAYEEVVCTLASGHVIEQRIVSGGPVPPSIRSQAVFTLGEYPARLIGASRERFAQVLAMLESELPADSL